MNNKIIKVFILFLVSIVISILCELFLFNYDVLFLNHNSSGIQTVKKYKKENINNKTIIKFDLKGKYVKKIILKYKAEDDLFVHFDITKRDYYQKKTNKRIKQKIDNEVNYQVLNINSEVNKVKIEFNSNESFKINDISINNKLNLNFFRIIFMTFSIVLVVFLCKTKCSITSLHKKYFIVGLLLGSLIIILQPSATFYSWDDQTHFNNIKEMGGISNEWSVSEYQMIDENSVGRDNISSIEEQENQKSYLDKNDSINLFAANKSIISYNKAGYIPLFLGYNISKLIKLPFSICFKIAKMFNLIVFLLIMSFAIKKAFIGKRVITVIGLLPSTIFLATQFSYDPAVISGLTLSFVYLLNWFVNKNFKVNFNNMLIFLLAVLYSCFVKPIYIIVLGLFIFIPKDRFRTKKENYWIKGFILIIVLLVLSTFAMPSDLLSNTSGDPRGGLTSVSEQFKLIISNPIGYLNVFKDTYLAQFSEKILGIQTLGGFAYIGNVSNNLYIMLLIIIIFVALIDTNDFYLKIKHRIIILFVLLVVIALIWTALYLSFTPVGLNTINGVQSRYFIPLLYPFIMILQINKIKNKISDEKLNFVILLLLSIISLINIYNLILVHYCL
ncbi:MAG: DUF2142 domain-containing protein [Bacilli bacterium]|nr:DUF2142 domain-containing protein [Bacilli bacterium]